MPASQSPNLFTLGEAGAFLAQTAVHASDARQRARSERMATGARDITFIIPGQAQPAAPLRRPRAGVAAAP